MNSATALQSIALYYQEGSSDKVYHATIEAQGDGFVVNFAYGRRGSTLNVGTKTQKPVSRESAEKIYGKLVAEKTGKGYTEKQGGVAFAGTDKAGRVSGLIPQLLNDITGDEAALEKFVLDDEWIAQEKKDGERRMTKDGSGVNRKGLLVPLKEAIATEVARVIPSGALDSEEVGDVLHIFDILILNGRDLRALDWEERNLELVNLFDQSSVSAGSRLCYVPVARGTKEKRSLIAQVRAAGGEGVVFKRRSAKYTPGRPNSGGDQVKFKFTASASTIVTGHNEKRSVNIAVRNDREIIGVGNVTIPPSAEVPPVGTIIEVRYLYAYRGGSLFQPTYRGIRSDLDESDCGIEQLKFKSE